MIAYLILLMCIAQLQEPRFAAALPGCHPTRCHDSGPEIRFPFRLRDSQPEHCGYSGFDLSCNPNDATTELEFQFPPQNIFLPIKVNATVTQIDYINQSIQLKIILPGKCLSNLVNPINNNSESPFQFNISDSDYNDYALFNCSGQSINYFTRPITCPDPNGFQVYATRSSDSLWGFPTSLSCMKMQYNVVNTILSEQGTPLRWHEPDCRNCEASGKRCRQKNNSTHNQTECYLLPPPNEGNVVVARTIVGVILIIVAIVVLYIVYRARSKRIQRFLEDYKALRPTRYAYSDIKKITDGFKHKLGSGGYGTVFKGWLSNDILVAVKVLNSSKGKGEEFINEVGTIGKIHHVNVVRLIGYCADGYKRALVYEFLENDSLEKYISLGNHRRALSLEKLHSIALGVAKGIDYLHRGCNQRILHFDIKPHNILLDQNLNPKVADFGLAKLCSKEQSVVTMTAIRGTIGYIAPEVFSRNFGKVSYKSDIYSFGMLLLDMVGGRKSFDVKAQNDSQVYFPEWLYNQLEKGEDIEIQVEEEREIDIVRRVIIVGLWCTQWYPVDRPSMKAVIQMLEGEDMPMMPPNPFANSGPEELNPTSTVSSSGSETSLGGSIVEESS